MEAGWAGAREVRLGQLRLGPGCGEEKEEGGDGPGKAWAALLYSLLAEDKREERKRGGVRARISTRGQNPRAHKNVRDLIKLLEGFLEEPR